MPRPPLAFLLPFGLLTAMAFAAEVHAASPRINGTTPFGAQRGVPNEVTINGANLGGNPRLIAPFRFAIVEPAPAGSDAANWKLRLNVDSETPVGVYPIRIQTDDGVSNPFLFAVGQLPQIPEKEDNSTFETAQAITAPSVVEGQSAGNDVDYFKFPGKKGQRIVVDAQCARVGSGVDPSIRLTTVARKFVASADDSPGLLTDARLFATLPDDTDYVIELSDSRYQGGGRPVYRLVVGEVPAAEEIYPLGGREGETLGVELRGGNLEGVKIAATVVASLGNMRLAVPHATQHASAGPVLDVESLTPLRVSRFPEVREPADPKLPPVKAVAPVVFNGRIDPEGDEDQFTVVGVAGQKYRVEVEASDVGSALDGTLQVLGAKGAVVASNDDTQIKLAAKGNAQAPQIVSPDPSLEFTMPAGLTEVTLSLRDLESRGGLGFPYRIIVTPSVPSFAISLNDSEVDLPKGGVAAIPVSIERRNYGGAITIKVVDPPAGLTFRPGLVAAGQVVGVITVSADASANLGLVTLKVVGEGEGADSPTAEAGKTIVFAQQAILPTNSMRQEGLVLAPALERPVVLETQAEPVEVVHGYGANFTVKARRTGDANAALALSALPLPPGVTVPNSKIDEKAAEGKVAFTTTTDIPLGSTTIAVQAKGKLAGADQTLAVPAVTLNVIRPAAVELAMSNVELKAGQSVELKGKVVRKGDFKEPVTVKPSGLPAGVKADPVTVAPDASEFTIKLTAEEKAAAATASSNVALAFQVNKKDYPSPPTAALAIKVLPAK